MPRANAPPRGTAATNHAVLGRRTSAQTATVNAAPNGPVRPSGRPVVRSRWTARRPGAGQGGHRWRGRAAVLLHVGVRLDVGDHDGRFPNSTSIDSGR